MHIFNNFGLCPRISCVEKEQEPICIPSNCQLATNETHCLTTELPVKLELEDFECEKCVDGRTKLRPVLVQVSSKGRGDGIDGWPRRA